MISVSLYLYMYSIFRFCDITDVTWYNNTTVLLRYTVHQTFPREVSGRRPGRWLNQYLPGLLTSLNVSDSRFRKLVMFWMWCHHDMALWRHGCGAWHNGLILTTASNANSWADVANHVIRLWHAGDTENFERRFAGYLWAVSWSRAAPSQDKG